MTERKVSPIDRLIANASLALLYVAGGSCVRTSPEESVADGSGETVIATYGEGRQQADGFTLAFDSEPSPVFAAGPEQTSNPSRTPEPTKTPTPVKKVQHLSVEAGVGFDFAPGQLGHIVEGLKMEKGTVDKMTFDTLSPGCSLLVPEEYVGGILVTQNKQNNFSFEDEQGNVWILANFNMPKPESPQDPPYFNTPNFVNLMEYRDEDGNRYWRAPFQAAKEGQLLVVYSRDEQYWEGLVDSQTGQLVAGSEKPYWQIMPKKANEARMVRYKDAVYVVFLDKNGNLMDEERIKLLDLPKEPQVEQATVVPEPTVTTTPPENPEPPTPTATLVSPTPKQIPVLTEEPKQIEQSSGLYKPDVSLIPLPEVFNRIPPFSGDMHDGGYPSGNHWRHIETSEARITSGTLKEVLGIDADGNVHATIDDGSSVREVLIPPQLTRFSIVQVMQGKTEVYRTYNSEEIYAILAGTSFIDENVGVLVVGVSNSYTGWGMNPPCTIIEVFRRSSQSW
jgi:hypothetical protein